MQLYISTNFSQINLSRVVETLASLIIKYIHVAFIAPWLIEYYKMQSLPRNYNFAHTHRKSIMIYYTLLCHYEQKFHNYFREDYTTFSFYLHTHTRAHTTFSFKSQQQFILS